jgi:hypothetical protein
MIKQTWQEIEEATAKLRALVGVDIVETTINKHIIIQQMFEQGDDEMAQRELEDLYSPQAF